MSSNCTESFVMQVVNRLREFAALRAIEIKFLSAAATLAAATGAAAAAAAAASASADGGSDPKAAEAAVAAVATAAASEAEAAAEARISRVKTSGKPCKLQMRIAQVKADLICQHEKDLLVPAGGSNASTVLRLLRPTLQRNVNIASKSGTSSLTTDACVNSVASGAATTAAAATGPTPLVSLVGVSCIITSSGTVRLSAPLSFPWISWHNQKFEASLLYILVSRKR